LLTLTAAFLPNLILCISPKKEKTCIVKQYNTQAGATSSNDNAPGEERTAKFHKRNIPLKLKPIMDNILVVFVFTFINPNKSMAINERKKNNDHNAASIVKSLALLP
jgi:hypothetical protein